VTIRHSNTCRLREMNLGVRLGSLLVLVEGNILEGKWNSRVLASLMCN
jgi:hypothetical protein